MTAKRKRIIDLHKKTRLTDSEKSFIDEAELILQILNNGDSTKNQYENLCEKTQLNISYDTYLRFCKRFFLEEYKESSNLNLFKKLETKIIELYSELKLTTSRDIYMYLFKRGSLKKSRGNASSILEYSIFLKNLKLFLSDNDIVFDELSQSDKESIENSIKSFQKKKKMDKQKMAENDISSTDSSIEEISKTVTAFDKPKGEYEETIKKEVIGPEPLTPNKPNTKANPKKVKQIEIEHDDGTITSHHPSWLQGFYNEDHRSGVKNDITEKNFFYIQKRYQRYVYDIETIKNYFVENELLPNYSLLIYKPGDLTYIYRIINKEIYELKKGFMALNIDIEKKVLEARKKTIELVKKHIPKAVEEQES